jgi:hypothetical protein
VFPALCADPCAIRSTQDWDLRKSSIHITFYVKLLNGGRSREPQFPCFLRGSHVRGAAAQRIEEQRVSRRIEKDQNPLVARRGEQLPQAAEVAHQVVESRQVLDFDPLNEALHHVLLPIQ